MSMYGVSRQQHLAVICDRAWLEMNMLHSTPYYIAGNKQADRLADVAARYAQIPESVAKPVRHLIDGGRQIQSRIATIISALPGRPRLDLPKPPAIPRVTIQDLIDTSMHSVVHSSTNNRLTCLIWKTTRPYKSEATKSWLCAPCDGAWIDREMWNLVIHGL